ncbi:A disintegrin and metalloproteinase with thrombospondin motifs adt-1-like isoform X2 [Pomacea canaliculata]|uniref:A disintegrin and metalloproteinase with thrombospondin motifs adt-1-like isoform X2 n=1 Tax=Pomacea canaliculata TaxID=400727 RepID=UPI000D736B12|nr:A disintegrin and metalloproteinase with thrombospondin motifs adt-1-like isoform X2 [Pomacea canaliculata]
MAASLEVRLSSVRVRLLLVVAILLSLGVVVQGSQLTNRLFQWTRNPESYQSLGKRLTGHVVTTYTKYVNSQCALECLRSHLCKSFNFDRGTGRCEINSMSHLDYPADISDSASSEYHVKEAFSIDPSALGPCASNPCRDNGHCIETKTADDILIAVCLCKDGWTGSGCQFPVDSPTWGQWAEWGQCSVSCQRGWRMRTRNCEDSNTGQTISSLECYGADVDYGICVLQDCPKWEEWGAWGECSTAVTCGRGFKVRRRSCRNGGVPGVDRYCLGSTNETTPCQGIDCQGAMRLRDGVEHGEGRLEVYNDVTSEWGLVCADQVTGVVADLICRQIGFPGAYAAVTDGRFGMSQEQLSVTIRHIRCQGGERRMLECQHNTWNSSGTCDGQNIAGGVQCSVNGVWSLWGSWGDCSVTCENGTRQRTRTCSHPPQKYAGKPCDGETAQYKPCQMDLCPVNGVWNPWSDWSSCSATCGNGTQSRSRTCRGPFFGGKNCSGNSKETQECASRMCPVDGVWSEWGAWGACTLTCGNGTQSRNRTCVGPFYGGRACQGSSSEWGACNDFNCPVDGEWAPWQQWQTCNVTCGGGQQIRVRQCYNPLHGGSPCVGVSMETRICGQNPCPLNGVWKTWSEWNTCSVTCGAGVQLRNRTCDGPFYGGAPCVGEVNQTQTCQPRLCPVDGLWMDWGAWSSCSLSCGGGRRTRARVCYGSGHAGTVCLGNATESVDCNTNPCPVDGVWNVWGAWGVCTQTCGNGTRMRDRKCNGPFYGGANCTGPWQDTEYCSPSPCPMDGYFHDWADWSTCTVTCGGGSQWRNRVCQPPLYGGRTCVGVANETQACNSYPCPIDGVWQSWSNWSVCDVTCGGGSRLRSRVCVDPKYGGQPCVGSKTESTGCANNPCPIPGNWLPWTQWSTCTLTCGGGVRERSRACDLTVHGNLTAPCIGSGYEKVACHTFACTPYARTCTEWATKGLTVSTMADIDPDGTTGGLSPIRVYCDLAAQGGIGVTVIGHDSEERTQVQGWEGACEYKQPITYNVSFEHVKAIIDQSAVCMQFIRWECKAALIHNPNDNQRITTGWLTRTGALADYFGGALPGSGKCACGMTSSCADRDLACNCDSNDDVWREDSGNLTYKPDLPVTAFVAGTQVTLTRKVTIRWAPCTAVARDVLSGIYLHRPDKGLHITACDFLPHCPSFSHLSLSHTHTY